MICDLSFTYYFPLENINLTGVLMLSVLTVGFLQFLLAHPQANVVGLVELACLLEVIF